MEPIRFPAWRYHKDADPVIVNSEAEETALGPDWADTPAAFHTVEVKMDDSEPEPQPSIVMLPTPGRRRK